MKKFLIIPFITIFSMLNAQNETHSDSLTLEDLEFIKEVKMRKLGSMLSQQWELDNLTRRGTFKLVTYRPNYVMPLRWTDKFNRQPYTINPNRPQPEFKSYQDIESKFQVSLKSKILQGAFWGKGDLWVGYTQVAYWQVYNENLSRPFRELNYEPELMFVMPLNFSIGNFKWRKVQISVNHQSNGKEHELSRSWNRLILKTAHEWENFLFETQTAFRFKEKNEEDDNPDIEEHIGRWLFMLAYNAGGGHTFSASIRNNMSFKHNRNYAEVNYVFPLSGNLKGVLQFTHGYGDSLIEYNHKQTNLGFGIVLLDL